MLKVKSGEALSHFENFLEDVLRLKASQKVKSKFDFCLNVGQAGSWAGFLPLAASAVPTVRASFQPSQSRRTVYTTSPES